MITFVTLFVLAFALANADRNETVTIMDTTSTITNATTVAMSNCSQTISVEPFKRFIMCMHDRAISNNCTCLEPFSQSLNAGGEACHSLLNSTAHLCDLLGCTGCAAAESHALRIVLIVVSSIVTTFCVCCIVCTWTWCEKNAKAQSRNSNQTSGSSSSTATNDNVTIGGPDDGVPDAFFKKPNSV